MPLPVAKTYLVRSSIEPDRIPDRITADTVKVVDGRVTFFLENEPVASYVNVDWRVADSTDTLES